jgi:hypothetical protein
MIVFVFVHGSSHESYTCQELRVSRTLGAFNPVILSVGQLGGGPKRCIPMSHGVAQAEGERCSCLSHPCGVSFSRSEPSLPRRVPTPQGHSYDDICDDHDDAHDGDKDNGCGNDDGTDGWCASRQCIDGTSSGHVKLKLVLLGVRDACN